MSYLVQMRECVTLSSTHDPEVTEIQNVMLLCPAKGISLDGPQAYCSWSTQWSHFKESKGIETITSSKYSGETSLCWCSVVVRALSSISSGLLSSFCPRFPKYCVFHDVVLWACTRRAHPVTYQPSFIAGNDLTKDERIGSAQRNDSLAIGRSMNKQR